MWKPFRGALVGSQTITSRLLLAHHAEGHPVLRKGVRQMPTTQQHHLVAIKAAYPNEHFLTISSMGAQHNGTFPHGNASDQIPCRRN